MVHPDIDLHPRWGLIGPDFCIYLLNSCCIFERDPPGWSQVISAMQGPETLRHRMEMPMHGPLHKTEKPPKISQIPF